MVGSVLVPVLGGQVCVHFVITRLHFLYFPGGQDRAAQWGKIRTTVIEQQ